MEFDTSMRWTLHPRVSLRPEPFGAMAYHYDNRRLNFLRSPDLVELVENLGDFENVDAGLATLPATRRPAFTKALAALAGSSFLTPAPTIRAESTNSQNRCEGTKQHPNPDPHSEALEATRGGAPAPTMRAESNNDNTD
ncbi:MAG: mycofactocin biosynthesis chaperone MftB [Acidimicrobiales bacterium]|nr:mycofactocin biosynthesis chaperone MftB [Acidimicrobiales bacterium]